MWLTAAAQSTSRSSRPNLVFPSCYHCCCILLRSCLKLQITNAWCRESLRSAAVWLNSHGAGAASEGEVNRPGAGAELGNPQPAGLNSPQDGATTLAANEPRHESPSKQMVQVPHSPCAQCSCSIQDPGSRLQIPDAAAAAIAAAGWDSSAVDHSNSRQQPGQLPSLKVPAPREASPVRVI